MGCSTFQNFVSFAAWQCAAFSLIVAALITFGGVGTKPGLFNSGVELVQWHLDGPGQATISNFYTYRLYLHRLCVVQHSQSRGAGYCVAPFGGLRRGFLSAADPDAFVTKENPFDPVMGRLNMSVPAVAYSVAFAALALAVTVLPRQFLVSGRRRSLGGFGFRRRYIAEMAIGTAMSGFIIASAMLTVWMKRFTRQMEEIPQISLVFKGHVFLALTWTATGMLIVAFFSLVLRALWIRYTEVRRRTFDVKDPRMWSVEDGCLLS